MKVRVSVQIPLAQFRSEWDDPIDAAHSFSQFLTEAWRGDLQPLADLGIEIQIDAGLAHEPKPGVEVKVSPYEQDSFDMMQRTRALLSDKRAVWERFRASKAAQALYR